MKCCESAGCAEDVSTVAAIGDRLWMVNAGREECVLFAFLCCQNCDENASVGVLAISTAPLVFPVNIRRQFHLETDKL